MRGMMVCSLELLDGLTYSVKYWTVKTHFFSSDESEEDEDHRKKFKIKIKPLPSDCPVAMPSVDQLKASICSIALSPSPMRSPRRSPGVLQRNTSGEEIPRPRRPVPIVPIVPAVPTVPVVAPTPAPVPQPPSQQTQVLEDATALFGPPLDSAFGEQKTEAPPPLPPKNVPTSPPTTGPPSPFGTEVPSEAEDSIEKPSFADLDNIFGPEEGSSAIGDDTGDQPTTSPRLPSSPRPITSSAVHNNAPSGSGAISACGSVSTSPGGAATSLPPSPDTRALAPPAMLSSPVRGPRLRLLPPCRPSSRLTLPSTSRPPRTHSSPGHVASSPRCAGPSASLAPGLMPPPSLRCSPSACSRPSSRGRGTGVLRPAAAPLSTGGTSTAPGPGGRSPRGGAGQRRTDFTQRSRRCRPGKPEYASTASPADVPCGGLFTRPHLRGNGYGQRPSTPSSVSPSPPPPPPRPPSRPKLPPGKPTAAGDVGRLSSAPVQSASPPPIAPLARAESTSSISSNNSLSTATTPTVGKELSVSVSEDDAYVDKLPTFERHFDSLAENDQPSLVWFDRGKFYLTFEGCSRGPSPLTMGAQDTLPVAAAFTETVNAFFKGADTNKCVVKIIGEMVLSFPAGITRHFANNPCPAVLTFSITNYSRLEHVLPNPQLLCCDTTTQAKGDAKDFWVNMPNLISHLKKVSEQKPQATYYNVDMLKYQVSTQSHQSTPLNLAVSWRCEAASTDLRIDYKFNGDAMSTPVALNNVQFLTPVDGGVSKLQAVLPPAQWNAEHQRILWKIPDISQKSDNGGVGSLLARFRLSEGPSKPAPLAVQFTSEGSTLSGCDIELAGPGYRFSLVKKRFAAGKYLADN
ncbi:unnamed protein product [Boreogadus saida]